jgi:hypothetical protein
MNNNHPHHHHHQQQPQIINVGQPRHPQGWVSTHVKFHNFPSLSSHPTHRNNRHHESLFIDSPIFTVHNVEWYLRVYPRGQQLSNNKSGGSIGDGNHHATKEEEESVSLYLRCKTAADNYHHHHQNNSSAAGIHAEFSLALYRTDHTLSHITHCPITKFGKKRKGYPTFISRKELLKRTNKLMDESIGGTLTVVVSIQLYLEEDVTSVVSGVCSVINNSSTSSCCGSSRVMKNEYFVPNMEKNVNCRLLRLWEEANPSSFGDKEEMVEEDEGNSSSSSTMHSSDVTFIIDGETLHAHSLILNMMAPTLASLCSNSSNDDDDDEGHNNGNHNNVPIPIVGVRAEIFRYLLRYLYGASVPEEVWNNSNISETKKGEHHHPNNNIFQHPAMELLDASNRYGVVDLKILAEVHVVQGLIGIETASDLFLYADANNCALLKEQVLHYFKGHAHEIRQHPSFQKVRESTDALDQLMEVLTTTSSSSRVYDVDDGSHNIASSSSSVDLLRRKLHERGLDVDGSREMLIQRLAKWDNKKGAR